PEGPQVSRAEDGGSVKQSSVDSLKRNDERLHRKWKAVQDRGKNQSGESERQTVAEEHDPEFSQRTARPHGNQRVKAEHRRRQHQRQRHQRFEEEFSAPG